MRDNDGLITELYENDVEFTWICLNNDCVLPSQYDIKTTHSEF